jgi:HEAT repeat protein/beta-lactamase regulating signal transducer with metallopeptidase domain
MIKYSFLSPPAFDVLFFHTKIIMLISAVMLTTKLLTKSTASMRHALWLFLFVIILFLPILSRITPQWHQTVLQVSGLSVERSHTSKGAELLQHNSSSQIFLADIEPSITPAPMRSSQKSVRFNRYSRITTSYFWIGIWATGFFLFNLRYIFGQIRLHKLVLSAKLATDALTSTLRREIKSRYHISSRIQILHSDRINTPLAVGFIRHMILLPENYLKWSADHLKYVLLHEAAHISRRDVPSHFFVQLVTTLYWFNPFVWLARKQFTREREHACDGMVLAQISRPSDYAHMLLDVAKSSVDLPHSAYAGLSMACSSQLEGRLMAILNQKWHPRQSTAFAKIQAISLFLLLIAPILIFSPVVTVAYGQNSDTTHTALVIESLKYALNDDDGDVREEATKTLGKIKSEKATELLLSTLQESNDMDVEVSAAKILLQRGETAALRKFTDGLAHEDVKIRLRSAKILKELRHPDALFALTGAMNDDNPEVQKQVLRAICELRTVDAIPLLSRQLKHEDSECRALAAWGLGEIEDPAILPYLYDALGDPESKVRCNAVESIGDLKQVQSALFIEPLLQENEWVVRREAVRVLAEIKSIASVPHIIKILHDDNRRVREEAASALGDLGDARAIVPLSAALHDKSEDVRKKAADALGKIYEEK